MASSEFEICSKEGSGRRGLDLACTIREVIRGLKESEMPSAKSPGLSATVLANEVDIPKDLKKACNYRRKGPLQLSTIDGGQRVRPCPRPMHLPRQHRTSRNNDNYTEA